MHYHYKKAALLVPQCYYSVLQHQKEKTDPHLLLPGIKILMKSDKFEHVYRVQSEKLKQ